MIMKLLRNVTIVARLYIMFGVLLLVLLYIGISGVLNGFDRAGRIAYVSGEIQAVRHVMQYDSEYSDRMNAAAEVLDVLVGDMFSGNVTVLIMVIIGSVIVAIAAIVIVRSIVSPIGKLVEVSKEIAIGNTKVDFPPSAKDEVGELTERLQDMLNHLVYLESILTKISDGDLSDDVKALSDMDKMGHAVANMLARFNELFSDINDSASNVSQGNRQIANGATAVAQGAAEQAEALNGLSASIISIKERTTQNAAVANEAADMSGAIRQNAEKGNAQMDSMMQAVTEINDASGKISKVIKVIDDIAFQTNILALNAAVEAARAGQHGKGFAVVAEEVRNLAAKSAEAAKDTSGLIENTVTKANLGMNIALQTAQSLKEIVEGINHSSRIIEQIATESGDQLASIGELNEGIMQISQVVQQNSAFAQESAASSDEMSGQAVMLEELVSQFKLRESVHINAAGIEKPGAQSTSLSN